jgi:hypothetical protein
MSEDGGAAMPMPSSSAAPMPKVSQ